MNLILKTLIFSVFCNCALLAQTSQRWQQEANYKMNIDVDLDKHQYKGTQSIVYTNNSPDPLNKLFYHLYFNAFQPNSMMDVRSQDISDPDRRVKSRIGRLSNEEIGFIQVNSLTLDGAALSYETVGTILEVALASPILPGSTVKLEMEWDAQVPVQIRRSGRDNKEGINYSMSQWYPKLCEYDYQGWHSNPYVGREFHGIWGDFDVNINIASDHIVGGSGLLQPQMNKVVGGKKNWHFIAENVHDFVWAADPDYTVTQKTRADGTEMKFYFQENDKTRDVWARLPDIMDKAFDYINTHFGQYPYPVYSFIQGGDGGMEYPMATLITGERGLGSLVGVSVHELMHSWYQMILGTNESLYAWMDEGFTSYATDRVMNHLKEIGALPGEPVTKENLYVNTYASYINFNGSGIDEPLSTHADHFNSNAAYGVGSYVKGNIFLNQLEYIIGKENFDKGMLQYFEEWKFRHPNPNDFIRVMEKQSGIELDWYKEYWVNSTRLPDYNIKGVSAEERKSTKIKLTNKGKMPMPVDLVVTFKDGTKTLYHIPLRMMRGEKPMENQNDNYVVLEDWPWTHPDYEFVIPFKIKKIKSVNLDPSNRMCDSDRSNNEKVLIKN